jgi:hypothetical protein
MWFLRITSADVAGDTRDFLTKKGVNIAVFLFLIESYCYIFVNVALISKAIARVTIYTGASHKISRA